MRKSRTGMPTLALGGALVAALALGAPVALTAPEAEALAC